MNTEFVNTSSRAFSRISKLAMPLLVGALISVASVSAFAQAPQKVAVLDMSAALFNSDKAKAVDEQLKTETSEDEQKIRNLAEEGRKLQEKMQKDGAVMSDADKRKIEDQLQEINVQYQYLVQKIQKLLEDRRQQFQQTYAPNLIQAITAVVEEESYDMVLRAEAVLHYTGTFDITAKVTEKLNKQ